MSDEQVRRLLRKAADCDLMADKFFNDQRLTKQFGRAWVETKVRNYRLMAEAARTLASRILYESEENVA